MSGEKKERRGSILGKSRSSRTSRRGSRATTPPPETTDWPDPGHVPTVTTAHPRRNSSISFIQDELSSDEDAYSPPQRGRRNTAKGVKGERRRSHSVSASARGRSSVLSPRTTRRAGSGYSTPRFQPLEPLPDLRHKNYNKIRPFKIAALVLLAISLVSLAIGIVLLLSSINLPAMAGLTAAIAATKVAEKIVLSVATGLLLTGLFSFVGSMFCFHRFRIHNRNDRQVTTDVIRGRTPRRR